MSSETDELDRMSDEQLAGFYRETATQYQLLATKLQERGMLVVQTMEDGKLKIDVYSKVEVK